jgi:hypothetical protein
MVGFTAGDTPALGRVWRITAKKTDFYIDSPSQPDSTDSIAHISAHGRNELFDGHRFHIKIDRQQAATAKARGEFVLHQVPRKGFAFDGQQLAAHAFRVARIRWTWDLQRPRFRAAAVSGLLPDLGDHQSGARLPEILPPNHARDIDLVISYGKPYWPDSHGSLRDNARLSPLHNDAGLWLTATSYLRSQPGYPAPEQLVPRLPQPGEKPARITCGAPGFDGVSDMYWFVETITSQQVMEASAVP